MDDVNGAIAAVRTSIEGMADASNKELQDAAIMALNFADVFEIDINRAAQVAGQAVKNGLAKDATEAFDLLITASQQVPKNLREDVLDASDEYAQFFATLGYDGEQAFSLLVDNADKGAYGIDKAGDAVKEFTIRSTDMSKASVEAYGAIGLNAQDMANKILAGGESAQSATQQVIDGLLGIKDPASQVNTAMALFGTPIEDLNTSEIPAFLKSLKGGSDAMDGTGGAAKRLDKTLNDNAISSLSSLKRQVQVTFYSLGNWALPIVNDISKSLAENFGPALSTATEAGGALLSGVQGAFDFIASHKTTFSIIAGTIMVLLIPAFVALVIQAGIAATGLAISWAGMVAGAAISAGMYVLSLTLVGASWILASGQALLAAGRMAAAWLIAMGPIGLAIAAFVGIVIAVVKNWDTIKEKTGAAWEWVVDQVRKVPGLIVGFFLNFTLPGLIIKHWDSITSTFSDGADSVVSFVRKLPGRILNAIGDLGLLLYNVGGDVMRGLRDGIEGGFQWIREKLSGVGKLIPGWLKSVLGISSPSKVMRDQVGKWIPAGVADGIEAGLPGLRSTVEQMGAEAMMVPGGTTGAGVAGVAAKQAAAGAGYFGGPDLGSPGDGPPTLVQHVHPAPGMDEQQLGDSSANAIMFGLSKP